MIFWLAVSLCASAGWCIILALSRRGHRIWPPERGNWLTAIWAWLLTIAIYVGLIRSGTADWNAFDLPAWLRWGIGGVALSIAATWVQGRAIVNLGLAGTSGWDVGLVTHGAYARRRHPQYLAQILSMIGLAILFAAPAAMLAALAGSAALVWASLAEDRHLARTYPRAYARYAARVRFY